ncbi:MAG: UDP-N-acetylglucosamine 1-carboxyvinyltransferase [Elusimicrobiales bacterium]|uniref:UDP-N-acetylglucosamine 1-carboxyvinyltransferase n=1 Tax=Candidatus Avelusimicrobium sp. TaxID=3048833 RepID=UPI0026F4E495|nr:UDP-N-acetylglucosamine 1-carboxyvinyltransferase [Elusimicrobiales bacterium]
MDRLLIRGGKKLQGTVRASGSKNAALPILVATLLTDEPCVLHRVPDLRDVRTTLKILEYLGKKVTYENGTVTISADGQLKNSLPYELVKQMRASFWVAGPLLARFLEAEIPLPGGCAIGVRPVDIHLKGFEKLGATCEMNAGNVILRAQELVPSKIVLRFPSVGATQNLLMCACLIEGETVLENVAKEPEIDDVIDFLNKMGADISTDDKGRLVIYGKKTLHGAEHEVVADRIESGSYMLAAAATRGDVTVTGCVPEHNAILLEDLQEAGFTLTVTNDSVRVHAYDGDIKPIRVRTAPYPGFATDLQAPWMTLMCLSDGTAEVDEDIFENRFMHAPELVRMGAQIVTEKSVARITGVKELSAAHVQASDLRGGMALVIAGLCAKGETEVERVYHIDRGYENLEEKLTSLGADIKRYNPEK